MDHEFRRGYGDRLREFLWRESGDGICTGVVTVIGFGTPLLWRVCDSRSLTAPSLVVVVVVVVQGGGEWRHLVTRLYSITWGGSLVIRRSSTVDHNTPTHAQNASLHENIGHQ
jgi:hypothetical protein